MWSYGFMQGRQGDDEADWEDDNREKTRVKVVMVVSSQEMHGIGGIIIETWDRVVRQGSRSGRKYAAYQKAFDEKERAKLSRWHAKLYGYEMRTGYPHKGVSMSVKTYYLLARAANFFASI